MENENSRNRSHALKCSDEQGEGWWVWIVTWIRIRLFRWEWLESFKEIIERSNERLGIVCPQVIDRRRVYSRATSTDGMKMFQRQSLRLVVPWKLGKKLVTSGCSLLIWLIMSFVNVLSSALIIRYWELISGFWIRVGVITSQKQRNNNFLVESESDSKRYSESRQVCL